MIELWRAYKNAQNPSARKALIEAALKWSSSSENNKQGSPLLHTEFAHYYDSVMSKSLILFVCFISYVSHFTLHISLYFVVELIVECIVLFMKWKQIDDFENAQKHYLRSTDCKGFVEMLHKWSLKGYPSECDLFIGRAVLMYSFS